MQALGAAEKVFELIKRKPKISTDEGDVTTEYLKGRISFKNVTFSYPMRPNQTVLKVCVLQNQIFTALAISRRRALRVRDLSPWLSA